MIEPLLLFWLLFLPGMASAGGASPFTPFNASAELARVLLFDLPATALILYLLFKDKKPAEAGFPRPRVADAAVAAVSFGALVATALILLFVSRLIHGVFRTPLVEAPRGLGEWTLTALVCVATGYFEESYFRAFLFMRFEEAGFDAAQRLMASVLLFSLCHVYEGFWGVFNAAVAALILSLAYLRGRSVHGPAWAHALYNALVYLNGS